jgi:hypothetical protein
MITPPAHLFVRVLGRVSRKLVYQTLVSPSNNEPTSIDNVERRQIRSSDRYRLSTEDDRPEYDVSALLVRITQLVRLGISGNGHPVPAKWGATTSLKACAVN